MGRKHNKTRRKTKKDKKKQRKAKIGKNTSKWARVQMKQIANFKKNKAAKTKTRKKNKGGRHHAHPTGLGDGDNRKIDQYLAEERIRDLQIQDPSVLAESEAIERGDVAAIDRRNARIEDARQRLAALADARRVSKTLAGNGAAESGGGTPYTNCRSRSDRCADTCACRLGC